MTEPQIVCVSREELLLREERRLAAPKRIRDYIPGLKTLEEVEEVKEELNKRQKTLEKEKEMRRIQELIEKRGHACSHMELDLEGVDRCGFLVHGFFVTYGIKNRSDPEYDCLQEHSREALKTLGCKCKFTENSSDWEDSGEDWNWGDRGGATSIPYTGTHFLYHKACEKKKGERIALLMEDQEILIGRMDEKEEGVFHYAEKDLIYTCSDREADRREEYRPKKKGVKTERLEDLAVVMSFVLEN